MESLQWQYQPTPKELNDNKKFVKVFAGIIYATGLIYLVIYYFNKDITQAYTFIFMYVAEIFFWHTWLKRFVTLCNTSYTIDEKGISINYLETKRIKNYAWHKMESFTDNEKLYLRRLFQGRIIIKNKITLFISPLVWIQRVEENISVYG